MATRSVTLTKPSYANGKELVRQIFLETMATLDVRHAMLTKVKREGGTLVSGDASVPLLRRPRVIALGKAATRMAATLDEILGSDVEVMHIPPTADQFRQEGSLADSGLTADHDIAARKLRVQQEVVDGAEDEVTSNKPARTFANQRFEFVCTDVVRE